MDLILNVKAQTVPAILIVAGLALTLTGSPINDVYLLSLGQWCLTAGVGIEILYIIIEVLKILS
ncbi:MAG: hypothetical protein ACFFER_17605 [Candidatus Thorarchaeota archaeon]